MAKDRSYEFTGILRTLYEGKRNIRTEPVQKGEGVIDNETTETTGPHREGGEGVQRDVGEAPQELFQRTAQELEQAPVRRAKLDPVWYFSALTEALNSLPESKTQPKSAKEWAQIIKPGMVKGVTKDEIIWTGLEQFLAHQHKNHKI